MPKTFLEYMNYLGGFGLSYAHSALKPIASLGDTPPKGSAGRTSPGAGLHASTNRIPRKKEQGDEQDKISNKISKMVKANEDNNNVILKQVNESLAKVEDKSDEKLGLKQDVEIVEEENYKTFRDKYNA